MVKGADHIQFRGVYEVLNHKWRDSRIGVLGVELCGFKKGFW